MKRTLILSGLAALLLTACGGGGDNSVTDTALPAPPPPDPLPTPVTPITVSAVLTNQTGFLTDGVKGATVVTDAETPLTWELISGTDNVIATGATEMFGSDTASGETVHKIDFSSVETPGTAMVLRVNDVDSQAFDISNDMYASLVLDSAAFFYHQRSGTAIDPNNVGVELARPQAHAPDIATCFGPDDVNGNTWGGCPYTLDVSGGWYDAGDHGKYVVNSGISVWTLMNAFARSNNTLFSDGAFAIPESANGIPDLLDEVRWNLNFMMAMQVPEGTMLNLPLGNQYNNLDALIFTRVDASGMVHHKVHDERWAALPLAPHNNTLRRFLSYPSTSATLILAGTGAQCARLFRDIDPAYSSECLSAAELAYDAALRVPNALGYTVTNGGGGTYGDTNLADEFYFAAVQLFLATDNPDYLADATSSSEYLSIGDFNWPQLGPPATLELATVPSSSSLSGNIRQAAADTVISAADGFVAEIDNEGFNVPFTRSYGWGSNSDMLYRAIILGTAFDLTQNPSYRNAVISVMDYLLGRNPLAQSYISGYGENPMRAPHHRFWAGAIDETFPLPPPGVMAGGPNKVNAADSIAQDINASCAPMTCYRDEVAAFSLNEVTINWNAPLVWVSSFLASE